MNKWIAFVAGGLFALAFVITCGGHNDGAGNPATAGGSGVVWEYATLYGFDQTISMPSGVSTPAGATACQTVICTLNAFGADRWELVTYDSGSIVVFKRPK